MYIQAYDSYSDDETKEQLWALLKHGDAGFINDRRGGCIRFFIPERLVPFALLIDSTLIRKPKEDYIA
jgi:hypothetical protein